jgi:hypothetical protein
MAFGLALAFIHGASPDLVGTSIVAGFVFLLAGVFGRFPTRVR